jgi:hypothetical protein
VTVFCCFSCLGWEKLTVSLGSPKTCPKFVAEEPEMFKDAYWEFGSFQVWQAKK